MSKANCYYRIDDAETLKQIDAFFEKRQAFFNQIGALSEKYGFSHYNMSETVQNGIRFFNLMANPKDEIDLTKWKTSKHRSGYVNVLPRAKNKEFKAEYDAIAPKRMEYTELSKIILDEQVLPWSTAYGYRHIKGQPFYFETTLTPCAHAVEVVGSEYLNAYSEPSENHE